jgi:hypothetical protein
VRPGSDVRQRPSSSEYQRPSVQDERPRVEVAAVLDEEQQRLIAELRDHQDGMTVRQLQASLCCPRDEVERVLESLAARRVVNRLNTIVPSYVYRSEGAGTGVW